MNRLTALFWNSNRPIRLTVVSGLFLGILLIVSCSKSGTPGPPPVIPPTDSSTGNPDHPGDDTGSNEPAPITKNYQFSKVPVLYPETRNSLYLGAVLSKTDSKSLLKPTFISIRQDLRNPVTIYTNLPIDDFALENVQASGSNDHKLLSTIQANFDKGVQQTPSIYSASPTAFKDRFNYLRVMLGIYQDLNQLFDLGFKDTTRLDADKGRVVMTFQVIKANLILQPPIYAPFLKIDTTDDKWLELFGQNTPGIVSSLAFGQEVYLVMESDSSAEELRLALNRLFQASTDAIASGDAFNGLSSADQQLLAATRAYGYALGKDPLPHDGLKALKAYATLYGQALDPHHMGQLIYYTISDLQTFASTNYSFELTEYPQKLRE